MSFVQPLCLSQRSLTYGSAPFLLRYDAGLLKSLQIWRKDRSSPESTPHTTCPHAWGTSPILGAMTHTPLSQPCAEGTITPLCTAINLSQDSTHPTGIPAPVLNPMVTSAWTELGQGMWGDLRHEGMCGDTGTCEDMGGHGVEVWGQNCRGEMR